VLSMNDIKAFLASMRTSTEALHVQMYSLIDILFPAIGSI